MSRGIYTYTDLAGLAESHIFRQISHFPVITMSSELQQALYGVPERDKVTGILSGFRDMQVTDFRRLGNAFCRDWKTDAAKFNSTILLSEFIRSRIAAAGSDKKKQNWLMGCQRNIGSMLSAVILMEESQMRSEDLPEQEDRNLMIFRDAWKYLEKRDPVVAAFRRASERIRTKQAWNPVLQAAFRTNRSFLGTQKLIFHAFYYITPMQEMVMKLLEEAGYELIFLLPYDERYPDIYELLDETYSEKRGYPPREQWKSEKSDRPDPTAEIFRGRQSVKLACRLQIREYASVTEFVNDIKDISDQGYGIYSADAGAANRLLKDYFPDAYGKRKILSYPIGRFVDILNRMWDENLQTVVLDEDSLIECFSSGWMASGGMSGCQYLKDIMDLLPFFKGCRTAGEWESRMQLLESAYDNAAAPFMKDMSADPALARWQEAAGSPLTAFSPFAVGREKLGVILTLIRQLLTMASELFEKQKTIRVSDHIRRLEQILKEYDISSEMYREERQVIADIFDGLGQRGDVDLTCSPADIAQALNVYMSGRFNDDEIETQSIGLIRPMLWVDAACVKSRGKVHICMCDVSTMPGGRRRYPWPLTEPLVRECLEKTGNPLLLNLMNYMNASVLYNRYLMYSALCNKDVTLSWISTVGDKKLAPSPYLRLVSQAAAVEITPARRHRITLTDVKETDYGNGRICEYNKEKMPADTLKEAKMDYAICPMRYVLGYVVERYPYFQSEFQQSYALNALIGSLYDLMGQQGMNLDQIYERVTALFPGMRRSAKRQVYDYLYYRKSEGGYDYLDRSECGGYGYTDERLKIHFPNQKVRDWALKQYALLMTPDGQQGMDLFRKVEIPQSERQAADSGLLKGLCMYCPHVDYCRNARHDGEQEDSDDR